RRAPGPSPNAAGKKTGKEKSLPRRARRGRLFLSPGASTPPTPNPPPPGTGGGGARGPGERGKPRETGLPHQIAVAFAGGAAALVDRPDHQALPSAYVAGGKDAEHRGGEAAVLRLGVRARVLGHAELVEQLVLRPEKTHRQQNELGRV